MKHFAKKHRNELAAMLDNLDTYLKTLQSGVNPKQIRLGFTHDEADGAIAIDQRGAKGKPTQTRLYVYPDPDTQTLYLITIGDKTSQREDNAKCRKLIIDLREKKQNENDNRPVQDKKDRMIIYTDEIATKDTSNVSSRRISHALICTLMDPATLDKAFWSLQEIAEVMNDLLANSLKLPEIVSPEDVERLLKETSISRLVENESDMWRFKKEEIDDYVFTFRDLIFLDPNVGKKRKK
ncbi:MAG TPA: hypothetical protein VG097_15965 [Gemmata sp.]|jgi:hypothetical protein|nr:hypothetical protein [Gemmata sp.]